MEEICHCNPTILSWFELQAPAGSVQLLGSCAVLGAGMADHVPTTAARMLSASHGVWWLHNTLPSGMVIIPPVQ